MGSVNTIIIMTMTMTMKKEQYQLATVMAVVTALQEFLKVPAQKKLKHCYKIQNVKWLF